MVKSTGEIGYVSDWRANYISSTVTWKKRYLTIGGPAANIKTHDGDLWNNENMREALRSSSSSRIRNTPLPAGYHYLDVKTANDVNLNKQVNALKLCLVLRELTPVCQVYYWSCLQWMLLSSILVFCLQSSVLCLATKLYNDWCMILYDWLVMHVLYHCSLSVYQCSVCLSLFHIYFTCFMCVFTMDFVSEKRGWWWRFRLRSESALCLWTRRINKFLRSTVRGKCPRRVSTVADTTTRLLWCPCSAARVAKRTWRQWRRQDLLQGGAKMELMAWGTHSGLQGWVQQLLDD